MKLFDDAYIVVTGAAGFIGSNLIRHLNEIGFTKIIAVDELQKDKRFNNLVGKRFSRLMDPQQLFAWIDDNSTAVEAIVHLGALCDTTENDGTLLQKKNTDYSIELAQKAIKSKIRFLYASSAATYGDGSRGFQDKEDEVPNLKPLNLYGFSKQLIDLWSFEEGLQKDMVSLKFFNVYGPNEEHKNHMRSPISKFYQTIKERGYVELFASNHTARYADGEQLRDFIHVDDAVRLTVEILKSKATGIFNIGTGSTVSWNSLAAMVFDAMGVPVDIRYVPLPENIKESYQNYTCADIKKLESVLGKQKFRAHSEAVPDYVKKYLSTACYR